MKCSNDDRIDHLGCHQTIKGDRKPFESLQNDHGHILNEVSHPNGKPDKYLIIIVWFITILDLVRKYPLIKQ